MQLHKADNRYGAGPLCAGRPLRKLPASKRKRGAHRAPLRHFRPEARLSRSGPRRGRAWCRPCPCPRSGRCAPAIRRDPRGSLRRPGARTRWCSGRPCRGIRCRRDSDGGFRRRSAAPWGCRGGAKRRCGRHGYSDPRHRPRSRDRSCGRCRARSNRGTARRCARPGRAGRGPRPSTRGRGGRTAIPGHGQHWRWRSRGAAPDGAAPHGSCRASGSVPVPGKPADAAPRRRGARVRPDAPVRAGAPGSGLRRHRRPGRSG